jgi:hypothetical protein
LSFPLFLVGVGLRSPKDWIFDVVLTIWVPEKLNLIWRSSHLPGRTYLALSYHGDYACSLSRVAMSDSDGKDSSTQAPAARRVWVPVAMSCHTRHEMLPLPKTMTLVKPTQCWEAHVWSDWMPGPIPGRGGRWNRMTHYKKYHLLWRSCL